MKAALIFSLFSHAAGEIATNSSARCSFGLHFKLHGDSTWDDDYIWGLTNPSASDKVYGFVGRKQGPAGSPAPSLYEIIAAPSDSDPKIATWIVKSNLDSEQKLECKVGCDDAPTDGSIWEVTGAEKPLMKASIKCCNRKRNACEDYTAAQCEAHGTSRAVPNPVCALDSCCHNVLLEKEYKCMKKPIQVECDRGADELVV